MGPKASCTRPYGFFSVLRSVFIGSVFQFFASVVFPFRFCCSVSFFRMAYTVYSNSIIKIVLVLKFSIDCSPKTERIRKTYGCLSVCFPFFCGPVDLNRATEHDLQTRIGHVLYLNGTEKMKNGNGRHTETLQYFLQTHWSEWFSILSVYWTEKTASIRSAKYCRVPEA